MSYIVLARRYRPLIFDDVVGQENIAQTLKNAIDTERVGHAYLFCGPRGVGKTSMARILAKTLNCTEGEKGYPCCKCSICTDIQEGHDIDVLEIDGASNRSIDDVRNIRENARYSPSRAKFKIYIIDEVHQLSKDAFNALLKILEEPPAHVKFIFATTEAHKLLPTVQSRCQRFDFRRISAVDIAKRLEYICESEKIDIDSGALMIIARQVQGGMRDALSLLDQLISFSKGKITVEDVSKAFGAIGDEINVKIFDAIQNDDRAKALSIIDDILDKGGEPMEIIDALTRYTRSLLICKACGSTSSMLDEYGEFLDRIGQQAAHFTEDALLNMIDILIQSRSQLRMTKLARIPLESAVLKISSVADMRAIGDFVELLKNGKYPDVIEVEKVVQEVVTKKVVIENQVEAKDVPADSNKAPKQETVREELPKPKNDEPEIKKTKVKAVPKEEVVEKVEPVVEKKEPVIDKTEPVIEKTEQIKDKVEKTRTENNGGLSIESVRNKWSELMEIVSSKKRTISAFLSEATPLRLENGKLILGFDEDYLFHRESLEEQSRKQYVESCLSNILNEQIRIGFETTKGVGRPPAMEMPDEEKISPAKEDNTLHYSLEEPAVRMILDLFEGEVIDVIDE